MSIQEKPTSLPEEINLLDENKSIVILNQEYPKLKEFIQTGLGLAKYNYIVTAENIDISKKTATELNKIATNISTFRKDKKTIEMKDIDLFNTNLVSCEKLIQDKRQELLKDIEEAEKELVEQRIINAKEYLEVFYNEVNLREEFRNITVDDMTKKGYATDKTNNLNKAAKDEIEKRVNEKLSLQTKVDNRILSLENECYKAKIEPLTVEHIQGFLYESDDVYSSRLQSLIDAEVKRNEKVKQQAKEQAEQEARNKVIADQKALKDELEARYLSQIRTADIPTLTRINIELKSYDDTATYGLKQKCNDRQREIEDLEKKVKEAQKPVENNEEVQQQEHLKAIQKKEIKKVQNPYHLSEDGKVLKTLSCSIRVPINATDEQVIGAVINLIKADKFPIENIKVS